MAGFRAITEVFNLLSEAIVGMPEKFENARISFETFTGSMVAANTLLTQIQGLGGKDPFATTALLDVGQRLVALGTPADQVASKVQDIATAVAAVGGTDADLQKVAQSLARVQETGTLSSRTMLQLVNEQIPAWQILEVGLGKTQAQLVEMLKTGQISADVFTQAFHAWATSGDVADVLGKRADTVAGSMTVLSNVLQQAAVTALTPFTERLNAAATTTTQFAQSGQIQQWATGAEDSLSKAVTWVDAFRIALEKVNDAGRVSVPAAMTGQAPVDPKWVQNFNDLTDKTDAFLVKYVPIIALFHESYNAAQDNARALDGATTATRGYADSADALNPILATSDQSLSTFAAMMNSVTDATTSAETAQKRFANQLAQNQPSARGADSYEGQTLASVAATAAQTQALMDSSPAAIAAAKAQDALNTATEAANSTLLESIGQGGAFGLTAASADAITEALTKTATAVGSVGQQALASIPGLAAFDAQMFGTSQALAADNLAIAQRVLSRLSARPVNNMYQKQALDQAQLTVDEYQRQVEFGSAINSIGVPRATDAKAKTGFASGGAFDVPGSGGQDSTMVSFFATPGENVSIGTPGQAGSQTVQVSNSIVINTDADADQAGADFAAFLRALRNGSASTTRLANPNLAGIR